MKETSIFVDAHVFDKEHQGTKTFIREIYRRMSQKPDIRLILAANNIQNLKDEFGESANIEFVKYQSTSAYKRLGVELPKILKSLKPDYAHFQYVVPPVKYCKYIVTTHDLLFRDFPNEFPLSYRVSKNILFQYSLNKSDVITTVSEYSKQAISKHYGIDLSEIEVIPNGVGDVYFDSYLPEVSKSLIHEKYKAKKYILYVSRIEPRKQQKLLLKAYSDLQLYLDDIELVFIGHQSIVDKELNELIESFPKEHAKKLHFLKNIPDDDLLHFYKGAEVFVYPSSAEGFGIPPLESGALRIPTISSNATAMRDFTFFGEMHIEPELNKFKKAMGFFFKNTGYLSDSKLDKISQEIQVKYSWDNSVNKLHSLIK